MGTPEFSIPSLKVLHKNYNLKAVVTQHPKPANRGMRIKKSPVQIYSENLGLCVLNPKNLSSMDISQQIKQFKPDFLVVVAYGLILTPPILKIPRLGAINGHASLLPKWRGASPIQRSIEAGDIETGCTSMLMDNGLDTGDILLQKKLTISSNDNTISIHDKLSELTSLCLHETLENILIGKINPVKQNANEATYAKKLIREEGLINWKLSAEIIFNKLRAFQPFPGIYTLFKSKEIKIIDGKVLNQNHNSKPGSIISLDNSIEVACGSNTSFLITVIQRAGKKKLSAINFLKGFDLKIGDFFG